MFASVRVEDFISLYSRLLISKLFNLKFDFPKCNIFAFQNFEFRFWGQLKLELGIVTFQNLGFSRAFGTLKWLIQNNLFLDSKILNWGFWCLKIPDIRISNFWLLNSESCNSGFCGPLEIFNSGLRRFKILNFIFLLPSILIQDLGFRDSWIFDPGVSTKSWIQDFRNRQLCVNS